MSRIKKLPSSGLSWSALLPIIRRWSLLGFWLTMWIGGGVYLGGDGYSLGFFVEAAEYRLPLSGIVLALALVLHIPVPNIRTNHALYGLAAIGLLVLSLLFSGWDISDMPLAVVWGVGLLGVLLHKQLFLDQSSQILYFLYSLVIGAICAFVFPSLVVSPDILGIGAVAFLLFFFLQTQWDYSLWGTLFAAFFVALASHNFFLILLFLGLVLTAKSWSKLVRKKPMQQSVFFFTLVAFAIFLLLWWFAGFITFPDVLLWVSGWPADINTFFFGFGGGNTPQYVQAFADTALLPADIVPGDNGLLLLIQEYGFLGLAGAGMLTLFSYYNHAGAPKIKTFLLVWCVVFSSVFFVSEQGIVLFCVLCSTMRHISGTGRLNHAPSTPA